MTAELRSIYSGPIRRALDNLTQRVIALENATLVAQRAYQWKTATDATDPGAGFIKANASPAVATELFASIYGQQGVVVGWDEIEKDFDIRIYLAADASSQVEYTVSAPPTAMGGWYRIPVTVVDAQSFAPGNNTDVIVRVSGAGGGGLPAPASGGGLGVVKMAPLNTPSPVVIPAGVWGNVTTALTYTLDATRRYRVALGLRAVVLKDGIGSSMQLRLSTNPGVDIGESWKWLGGAYENVQYDWIIDGDGAFHSFDSQFMANVDVHVSTDRNGWWYLEDVGPKR